MADQAPEHHINIRRVGDKHWYSPEGDLAHNFRMLVREIEMDLFNRRWPWISDFCQTREITNAQLISGVRAYVTFIANAVKYPTLRGEAALKQCGWAEVPHMVRLVVLATLGKAIFEAQWKQVRRATFPSIGSSPIDENLDLFERIDAIADNVLHGGSTTP